MPYVQDDWRVAPKLTINMGMRYDYYSPVTEDEGHAGILNPVNGVFTINSYNANRFNFSPRFGAAYALNDKTAIHGGGGLYYYQFSYYDLTQMMNNPYFNTGLNSVQTQNNPVIWPASSAAANPDTGAAPGAQEYLTLAGVEKLWAAMPAPTGVFVPATEPSPKVCLPATASNGTWPCSAPSARTIC